jgi:AcrR family transcriptional regulator
MDLPADKASRKPRADSLRNRERLIEAARTVFAAGGPDASLEAVARTAGVGIATLYRHFPTREALFQSVYRHEVDQLVALAGRLPDQTANPVEALRGWLHAMVRMVATKKGMISALAPAEGSSTELYAESTRRLGAAVEGLIGRAMDAGAIRSDLSPEDVIRAVYGFCHMPQGPNWVATVVRLLDVFVDGLKVR